MYTSRCKHDNLTTWIIQTSLCYNLVANEGHHRDYKKIETGKKKEMNSGISKTSKRLVKVSMNLLWLVNSLTMNCYIVYFLKWITVRLRLSLEPCKP